MSFSWDPSAGTEGSLLQVLGHLPAEGTRVVLDARG